MFKVYNTDCLIGMKRMADASIDACVTDPPYGLSFMGKKWDYDVPSVEIFAEIFRVLKDGSRLLCFAGTRTMHRMWCNIEDAGFTIEDSIMWIYGSGFPKHKSKLKPAYEPVCVARKGYSSHLNIDDCRIEYEATPDPASNPLYRVQNGYKTKVGSDANGSAFSIKPNGGEISANALGRWPANIILDEIAAEVLDQQSGILTSGTFNQASKKAENKIYGKHSYKDPKQYDASVGGASRFFYCAKASRSERNEGCEELPDVMLQADSLSASIERRNGKHDEARKTKSSLQNNHPTVKPVALMRYLCKLITPEGGLILDPFCGSGSTGIGAALEGFNFIGVDKEPEYCTIAEARLIASRKDLPLFAA